MTGKKEDKEKKTERKTDIQKEKKRMKNKNG